MLLDYDENKPYCDLVDSDGGYYQILNNNAYIKHSGDDKTLHMKNQKTGEFEQKNANLRNINVSYMVGDDVLVGSKRGKQGNPNIVVLTRNSNGEFRLDAEFPKLEHIETKHKENEQFEIYTKEYKRKPVSFRYTREKNGKSYLSRRGPENDGYEIVEKIYDGNVKTTPSLEEKMKKIQERLAGERLEMGKTGDSKTGEVTSVHKKTANLQTEVAKKFMSISR